MTKQYELKILQKMVETALTRGYAEEQGVSVADLFTDSATERVHVRRDGPNATVDYDLTLPLFAPLTDRNLALTFFGNEITGDPLFGRMPTWIYHQYKMLDILQKGDEQGMFLYLATFL